MAAILLASQGQLTIACGLVFLAALFDLLDGMAARALGQGGSEFGKQLDSLADMVSFGVAPAFVLYVTASDLSGTGAGWTVYPPLSALHKPIGLANWPVLVAAIILVVASCWRLAKFNLDTRQTGGFLGLPTPSNGLFWVSATIGTTGTAVHSGPGHDFLIEATSALLSSMNLLLMAALMMAILMLSSLPLPSLKFKHFRWKGNEVIYLLAAAACCLLLLYGVLAVPLILILYLLSPLWGKLFPKNT